MTYLQTPEDIANASLDLIDEVRDVLDQHYMHAMVMHRFRAQPEAMAQILMCLAVWASEVDVHQLGEIAHRRAVDRARDRMAVRA